MVTEPWSEGASRVSDAPHMLPWDMGHFRGFEDSKRQANELRRKAFSNSGRSPNAAYPLPRDSTAPSGGAGVVFDGPGEAETGLIPPDPQIAAGPNFVVVAVNSVLAIYDKSGNLQGNLQTLASFFSGLGITGEIFDPRIIYDQIDRRYILSAGEIDFTSLGNGHVFLAVSATGDPTQNWYKYAIDSKSRNIDDTQDTFPDFPGLGLSPSAVYLTTNQFQLTQYCISTDTEQCFFSDARVNVVGLPQLLSGNSELQLTTFTNVQTATGFPAFAIQPAVSYGTPPAEFLVAVEFSAYTEDTLNLFSINTSGTPNLTEADLTVPSFAYPPDAAQEGVGAPILTDDFRPLNAVWANGSLWFAHNVADTNFGHVAAQWYELGLSDLKSASLVQSGSVAGTGDAFYPAISLNPGGTVGIAFTTASEFSYASAAFTAREPSDPLGAMRGYAIYRPGLGPYLEPEEDRWGDYSGVSPDPNGNGFWMIAEYAGTPNPNYGTAIAQVTTPPELSVTPTVLTFPAILRGQTGPPLAVTVTNIGSDAVILGAIAVGGANPSDFVLSADRCSGSTLAANQTCTFLVTFEPTINGTGSAQLSISYGSNVVLVQASGYGSLEAVFTISPGTQVVFPGTIQQSASSPQIVTLTNTGNTSGTVGNFGVLGDFTQTNNCGITLAAGASCQYTIVFHPTQAGLRQGNFEIAAGNGSFTVILSGTGLTAPIANLCPNVLSFSDQAVGAPGLVQPVILTNSGSDSLLVSQIGISGDFTETDNCVGGLPPRTSCTINVTFNPSAIGERDGSITVTDNSVGGPQTIHVTGTGVASSGTLAIPATPDGGAAARILAHSDRPLEFERNDGQFDSRVEFVAHSEGHSVAIKKAGVEIQANSGEAITMSLKNSAPAIRAIGSSELPGKANYFIGRDPALWRAGVPTYAQVKIDRVYPGIDLVYYGTRRQLEYDFIVAPGADPGRIGLRFQGQSNLRIEANGDLAVMSPDGGLRFHKPVIYQRPGESVDGRYRILAANEVGFQIASYDTSQPLIIDPVLSFSTYLAGSGSDAAAAIALDTAGNVYVAGTTSSPDFPVIAGAFQTTCGRDAFPCSRGYYSDAFVSKLSPSGSLIYSTYVGGGRDTQAFAVSVDGAGSAYVTGTTNSADYPVTLGSFQTQCNKSVAENSCNDAFVTKLNPTGAALTYSTFLGGTPVVGPDVGLGIAVDYAGNAYVGGVAGSLDFPTTPGALQTTAIAVPSQGGHGFVSKLNSAGTALLFSTYLGGTSGDKVTGVTVDASGSVYAAGETASLDFPTLSAFQTGSYISNDVQAFISKFSPSGSLAYSTYLGGQGPALANAIAVDSSGAAYIAGTSTGNVKGFPLTPGTLMTTDPGGGAFVTKLHPAGCALLYSTYLPESLAGYPGAIAVDSAGNTYLGGSVSPSVLPFPQVDPLQPPLPSYSGFTGFVVKLDAQAADVLFSTYLGGSTQGYLTTEIAGLALNNAGEIYLAGTTGNADFPLANAFQSVCSACGDNGTGAFVAKITPGPPPAVTLTRSALTFAPQAAGNTYTAPVQAVGLMNNQSVPLTISGVSITGGGFAFANIPTANPIPCTGTIAPGSGCVVQVQYQATAVGPQTGAITITDSGPGSPRTVALNGVGLGPFSLSEYSTVILPLATGIDSVQYSISVGSISGSPAYNGSVSLSCGGVLPATCAFSPSVVSVSGAASTLTVSGLSKVAGHALTFSVFATGGGQTATLPLSITFQGGLASIVSAANYGYSLAPESIAAAFGTSLATRAMSANTLPLPTTLNGTSVNVTGSDGLTRPAPLFYVSPTQVNFEMPVGTVAGQAFISIVNGSTGVSHSYVNITTIAPALFSANASGAGPANGFAIYVNPDGSQTYALLAPQSAFAPVALGKPGGQVYLELFGTGIRGVRSLANVTATVGVVAVPVAYAGLQGVYAGLDQVNLGPLPASLIGAGVVTINLAVDGQAANPVQIQVQ